ncbi:hypothetical protein FAIPA1_320023 [Frankia sp. AiPs1]
MLDRRPAAAQLLRHPMTISSNISERKQDGIPGTHSAARGACSGSAVQVVWRQIIQQSVDVGVLALGQ